MLFHLSLIGYSQVTITMEESGGVYKVPCTVNGLKMKFVFDTGASVVSLSQSMASFMIDNGYLSESDYLGKGQTHIADGSMVDVLVVNLKDFEVGGFHLSNVTATIKDGQNVPLLMGLSAIEKLGKVSLSGNKLIIHKPKVKLSVEEIALLRKEIQQIFKASKWEQVIEKSAQLKNATIFNNQWDYYYYIMALAYGAEFKPGTTETLLGLCDEWEASGIKTSDQIRSELYERKAYFLTSHSWDDDEAIKSSQEYLHKALSCCTSYNRYSILASMSSNYHLWDNGEYAIIYLKKAIEAYCEYKKFSLQMVLDNKVNDYLLGFYYYELAELVEEYNNDYADRNFYLKLGAKCGCQEAIDFCFRNNINYTK